MFGIRGFLAAPLVSKSGDVIGIIRALSKKPRDFTAYEIGLFEQLANGAAVAIENERLYTSLQKSDKVKSEFLGIMSHELRTPLNIIMGYAALAKEDLTAKGYDSGDNPITKIETQSRILLDMIDSIMEASQLEAGATGVTKQRVDISALFEQLQAAYDFAHAKELALIWRLPDDLPHLVTDDAKLQHILKNLINNAIKFTPRGSVTVSARVASVATPRGPQYDGRATNCRERHIKNQRSTT
jgi:signal transduction histidine kinase